MLSVENIDNSYLILLFYNLFKYLLHYNISPCIYFFDKKYKMMELYAQIQQTNQAY